MIPQLLDSATCLSCKGCCRFSSRESVWAPALLNEEISGGVIPPTVVSQDKHIRLLNDAFARCFICPFLNVQDDTCALYVQRPFECQLYPFVLTRTGSNVWLAADPQCPFVEKHAHEPDFKAYVSLLGAFFATEQGCSLLRNNGHLAQEYSGVMMLADVTAQSATRSP